MCGNISAKSSHADVGLLGVRRQTPIASYTYDTFATDKSILPAMLVSVLSVLANINHWSCLNAFLK